MTFTRVWSMPNTATFKILPVAKLLLRFDFKGWVDPFAGNNSPAEITNDIRENTKATHHKCALDFLQNIESSSVPGALYDPPYSLHQSKVAYESAGLKNLTGNMKYWADVKTELARIVKPGGTVVSFGWNSNGLGKGRGFQLTEVMLIPHGGSKNDTIVTIEVKL